MKISQKSFVEILLWAVNEGLKFLIWSVVSPISI
jgi:hypothetical protein